MSESDLRKPKSNPNSFVESLKTEWNLFWETILGEDEDEDENENPEQKTKDPFVTGKLEVLNLEQIKAITKALSSDRKTLNQKLESINKEIEENTAKLESLKLVGGESDDTVKKLNDLSDLGQNLSEQLDRINERLKLARNREDHLKKSLRET